jgi:dihydrofolate synthase/folylpolyglutamate synthase
MTYAEAIQFLYGLQVFGARPGLETTRQLAARAGNPQTQLRFIHVAGTNGKGSTCAMLESIYRAARLRVGLFTSPHLVSFRERIQVNRQLISEADVVRLVTELREPERRSPDRSAADPPQQADLEIGAPTLFEFVTVMALHYFAEQKCDLVIWETGLGGRLDATNIVTPLASVITNIGLDHQQWLGNTLTEIAAEKAGIIKPGVPVVTAASEREVIAVLETIARNLGAPLTSVSPIATAHVPKPALAGAHQQTNSALALATIGVLQPQIPVRPEAIAHGLASVSWPGRLQWLTTARGQRVLLDGAHNPAGVSTLLQAVEQLHPGARPTFIVGIFGDKDWRTMCEQLAARAGRLVFVPVGSERSAQPETLAVACRAARPEVAISCASSLPEALADTSSAELVVIAGSLYLVGEALALLDPGFRQTPDERTLNEWGGRAKTTQRLAPDSTR